MKKKINKVISPFFLDIDQNEKKLLVNNFKNILGSGKLILDKFTQEFELKFAKYVKSKYAICVNSGTSALEILITYHIKKKNTKVAVPTNTNFATVASIIKAGGYPVYIDMDLENYCASYDDFKRKYNKYSFKGIVWVHIGGVISKDFIKVLNFCKKKKIFLIEDCAHAHGSKFKGIFAGNYKDGGAFSFFPTKVMTTIEGGMITTNDIRLKSFAVSMRNQGKGQSKFGCYHTDMGNSWRMSEISAAMGILQLKKLDKMIFKRKAIYKIYKKNLKSENIKFVSSDHMDQCSYYKFIIICKSLNHLTYIKENLKKDNIISGGGVYELPCHQQPVFKKFGKFAKNLLLSEKFCPLQICLPLTSGMEQKDAKFVIKNFLEYYVKV